MSASRTISAIDSRATTVGSEYARWAVWFVLFGVYGKGECGDKSAAAAGEHGMSGTTSGDEGKGVTQARRRGAGSLSRSQDRSVRVECE